MQHGFIIKWYHIFSNAFFLVRFRMYRILELEAAPLRGSLLDFGCGIKPYETLFVNTTKYIGLDIEESGNQSIKKADVYYDGKTIPFPDNYFDNVFSSEVFEHVFNLEEIIPEINRVLKPGGNLLITCPFVWPEHEVPYDYARYTSFGFKHLLQKNGFEVKRQYKTGHAIEVIIQQAIFYLFCLIPKKPRFVYYILHQILILPGILTGLLLNVILFGKLKRKELYHSNIAVLTKK